MGVSDQGATSRRIYQVDAFTRERFSGNPAGVVANAEGLSDAQMQCIARELNNSETAFVLPPCGPGHDVHIRFFTPAFEIPVCSHATVAAHTVRAHEGAGAHAACQSTGAGLMTVSTEPLEDGIFRVTMRQRNAVFEPPLDASAVAAVAEALRVELTAIADLPVQIVSTGHSKVLLPLRDRATLRDLRPDFAALARLSSELQCNGYYPFVLADDDATPIHAAARMFAPAIGVAEDPVTGNAAGPLSAYLLKHGVSVPRQDGALRLVVDQGREIARPGRVTANARFDAGGIGVQIEGEAVVVFRTEVVL